MIINHIKTLVYYDIPQLFIAQDKVKTKFVCLLAECCSDYDIYLCVSISEDRLELFKKSIIDLLSIFREPETGEVYCAKVGNLYEDINAELIKDDIPQNWLPEPGFYMETSKENKSIIIVESKERGKAIIHFSIDTPETRQEFKIKANHLIEGLGVFQKLLRYAYKKSLSHLSFQNRDLLDQDINYGIEVFSFSPGSFTLHLQSESFTDMFGYVDKLEL